MNLDAVTEIAAAGGRAALEFYGRDASVVAKADGSPLTLADRASHRAIVAALRRLTPEVPVLSEESAPEEVLGRASWERFWLVDPLDGTKEFLKRTGEFTVNVALVERGEAVLGVVHVPVTGVTYLGARGEGAFLEEGGARRRIHTRPLSGELVVVASKDHAGPETDAILARLPGARRLSAGSALKFGLIAAGQADLYPRTGRTMEWDTAAGQCVVEAAGGRVTDLEGRPLRYNKADLGNPSFLVAGDPTVDWAARLKH